MNDLPNPTLLLACEIHWE